MKNRLEQIQENIKLDTLSKWLLGIAASIVVISFFTPIIFTRETFSNIDFADTGPIGDTIGGVMGPFIAIAGIMLTFLAFYIQFKANKTQFELFRLELDNQSVNQEIQEFENQFYEMLKLHKENVNETSLHIIRKTLESHGYVIVNHEVKGRPAFELLRKEFELMYYLALESFTKEATSDQILNEAYGVFFHGFPYENVGKHPFFTKLKKIKEKHAKNSYKDLPKTISNYSKLIWTDQLRFELFKGRTSILAHYFRHLFQTVKFIANQDEKLISYEEKRNYIRLLRAQLSDSEQALLFYNWRSKFGSSWENEINHFFTDYRMIHNLYNKILIDDIELEEVEEFKRKIRKENNRTHDPLFESEDWMRQNKHKLPLEEE